jgi:phasin
VARESRLPSKQQTSKKENAMNSISENQRSIADKGAAMANETIEKGKAAAERTARAAEQIHSATVGTMRDYNLKIIDLAQVNIESVFDLARQLAAAATPAEMMELWSSHARRQFEMLSEQTKELAALGQKLAAETAAPLQRSVNQALKRAS